MEQGKIIVIEGGDSSGKATQTALLKARLESEGMTVHTLDFPQYERTIGTLIKECLVGKRGDFMKTDARVASVLYAADRFDSKPRIEQWIAEGAVIILDRYVSASLLHQGAKILDEVERKETIQWIHNLEHSLFGMPVPDTLIYLDVPAIVRSKLHGIDEEAPDAAERHIEHQQNVDAFADSIMQVYENTLRVNCMKDQTLRTPEDIHEEIYSLYSHLD